MEPEHVGIKISPSGKACRAHGGTFDVCVGHWVTNLCSFCQDFSPSHICWTVCEIQHIWWNDKIYLWNGAFVYEQTCVGIVGRKAHNTAKVFRNYEPEPAVLPSPQFLRCDKLESQKPLSDCTLVMTQWVYFWKMKNNWCVTEGKIQLMLLHWRKSHCCLFFFSSPGSYRIYYAVYVLKENGDKLVPAANHTCTTGTVVFMEVVKHAVVSGDVWQCLPQTMALCDLSQDTEQAIMCVLISVMYLVIAVK